MSGLINATKSISSSSDPMVNALLASSGWAGNTINYAFPTSANDYDLAQYGNTETISSFSATTTSQRNASTFFLNANGSTGSDAFSLEALTSVSVEQGSTQNAHVRIGQTGDPFSPFAFLPGRTIEAGDVWLYNEAGAPAAAPGNYEWLVAGHEIGHALGLEHPHEGTVAPQSLDFMQNSIMSYRSYENGSTAGFYSNEQFGYAQTFMQYDIAALQDIYGANYATNNGDTTYSWSPTSGDTRIDGQIEIDAGANRIFATIWDGGGTDTYDLSAYSDNLSINLAPGGTNSFRESQKANLGNGNMAEGNIFNAQLFDGDTRSLIENAIGGTGNDALTGNVGNNRLVGGAGNDALNGGAGSDWLMPGTGSDQVMGGAGVDAVSYSDVGQGVQINLVAGTASVGGATDTLSSIENATGSSFSDYIVGTAGTNNLRGLGGSDWLVASDGGDRYDGGIGNDMVSYVSSDGAVTINLDTGSASGGFAAGDTFTSIERITGSRFQDNITGSGGDEQFRGLGGYDWFNGSAGRDKYEGGSGLDTVSYARATESIGASLTLGRGYDGDATSDTFNSIENITGTSFDDLITGDDGRNVLRGLYGEDKLNGGAGVDRLTGGGSDDRIDGGDGFDYAFFQENRDQYTITSSGNLTYVDRIAAGGEGTDTILNVEVLVFADMNVFL